MENRYLENAKEIFLSPPKDLIYEGQGLVEFDDFLSLYGYIIPNRVNSEEAVVYLQVLVNDIRNQNCGFHHSKNYRNLFQKVIQSSLAIDQILSYLPDYLKRVVSYDFYIEFMPLFKSALYHLNTFEQEGYGCIEIEPDVVDISNKNKADVLAALYNHAKPIGMGLVQYDPTPMDRETAEQILENEGYYFGYLKGRPIKMNLEEDVIGVWAYNRDNDEQGLAQKAIATCPNITIQKNSSVYQKDWKE